MSCITGWRRSIAQNLEHGFVALFLCKQFGNVFAVLILVDDDVLCSRDVAVLDAAFAPGTLLIGTSVEETDMLTTALTNGNYVALISPRHCRGNLRAV